MSSQRNRQGSASSAGLDAARSAQIETSSRIIEDAWTELQRRAQVQARLGVVPGSLPDISLGAAERRSSVGRSLLERLGDLEEDLLPHDIALTLRLVRTRAQTWSREDEWYWLVIDPRGIGAFGAFAPAAYCGAYLLNIVHSQLTGFLFTKPSDLNHYLALVRDYPRLVDQFAERTALQAERGIYMPRPQIQQARALLAALKAKARHHLGVSPDRVATLSADSFLSQLHSLIANEVGAAFDRALAAFSAAYCGKAPESVGLSQYAGGAEVYAELVRHYTTFDLTPEQVHARGRERLAQIEDSMSEIRAEVGCKRDARQFLDHLERDPRWRAQTADGVTAIFKRYIDRITPHLSKYFPTLPSAPYGVAPLPEAVQGSMTFGYYDAPNRNRGEGRYLFNPRNLTRQPLYHLAALTYHELVPGHHLHLASQQENETSHPFRAHSFVTAYVEGWAEYAATWAGEIGMYQLPEERYGRLIMDAFLTSRLVVDTGMNALGWSLERARSYMRAHSGMPEQEILTESLRYSCDYIGQALAYKLGDTAILSLRDRMRAALGDRFTMKDFHAAILEPGALTLPDLDWHVDHETNLLRNIEHSP